MTHVWRQRMKATGQWCYAHENRSAYHDAPHCHTGALLAPVEPCRFSTTPDRCVACGDWFTIVTDGDAYCDDHAPVRGRALIAKLEATL